MASMLMTICLRVHLTLSPSFLEHLRQIWKTTEPVFLTPGTEFSFLGITLELTTVGLLLHQKTYTEALLEEYQDVTPKRQRATTGEPEHFDKDAKSPPRRRTVTTIFFRKKSFDHRNCCPIFGCQLSELMVLKREFWLGTRSRNPNFLSPEIGASFYTNFECLMER